MKVAGACRMGVKSNEGDWMVPPNIGYSALLFIAGTVCLLVAAIILQTRRAAPGATSLMALLLALAWWDITYAIFWAGTPAHSDYFWLDLTYIGVVTVPAAFFIFSLQISNLTHWLKRPLAALIYLEPGIVLLLLFTDPYHGLFFAGKRTANSAVILDAGPVFWLNVVYSYSLILLTTILLVRTFARSSGLYRRQVGVILIGLGITWLNSIIFVAGLNPLPGADNTPFSFTITAVAFAYALLQYQLLDIVPVARDVLIEKMTEGVLVIDVQERIVDINPAARRMLNVPLNVLGRPINEVFSKWNRTDREALVSANTQFEIELGEGRKIHMDVQVTPIMDGRNRDIGRLIALHDITNLKNNQKELHLLATRDSLTEAINRGHFMELALKEVQRAQRYDRPISLILMDLDYFKNINDTYGHAMGDQTLVAFTKICTDGARKTDIFARLSGEEFVLLLPETPEKTAAELAERLRMAFAETVIGSEAAQFNTVSMGITELRANDTLENMLHRADKALYKAKSEGRNKVYTWHPQLG